MTFELLKLQKAHKGRSPAKFTIGGTEKAAFLRTTLTIGGDIAASAKLEKNDLVNIMIGRGDSAGKLRVVKDPDGHVRCVKLQTSPSILLHLGHVAEFGNRRLKSIPASADVISDGVVEVNVPNFADALDREDEAEDDEADGDAEDEAADEDGRSGAAALADAGRGRSVVLNGVTIHRTKGEERVGFNGKEIEVFELQANLVSLLARPRPNPVAEQFLVDNLWPHKPKFPEAKLRELVTGLRGPLRTIGLDLNPVKGVGFQLKDAGT